VSESVLEGLKVLDLGRVVAAPLCGMLLGDLGADVVKVEPAPDGDFLRGQHPKFADGIGSYFATANRNKRSLLLDLRSAEGMAVLRRLLAEADVLVENFRPGVLEAMGLDEATLERDYPALIVARVSAYGHTGPMSHLPGVDQIVQGVSGLMSVTGDRQTGPTRCGIAVCDLFAGLAATIGVLAALTERHTSGRGQVVRTSLLQATMAMMSVQAGRYLATGDAPEPEGNHHPVIAPYGLFETADGYIQLQVMHDRQFRKLADLCAHPEWADDPRFTTATERSRYRAEVRDVVAVALRDRPSGYWLEALEQADIPCGPVLDVRAAFESEQAAALGVILRMTAGDGSAVAAPGFPVQLSRTPLAVRRPPPLAGEHDGDVLEDWGHQDP
jgi:crotonobetainyl-CoA:carnitine CoA-transferase CaiB-like acyl-CoA transferase